MMAYSISLSPVIVSSRARGKGDKSFRVNRSEFLGTLKEDAVLLQHFLLKLPPTPNSLWRDLSHAGHVSCSFDIWILAHDQILGSKHQKARSLVESMKEPEKVHLAFSIVSTSSFVDLVFTTAILCPIAAIAVPGYFS
jgi:hypothetical protein